MELIVVMTVTLMLTGLLLPTLSTLRENAHRVLCSSNLRQTGLATVIYTDDHIGNLPNSFYAQKGQNKQEMMSVHRGKMPENWEGLGWLFAEMYCRVPEIFYCPSHTGEHPYERYEDLYQHPGVSRIYTNYHYAGDYDWVKERRRRLKDDGLVIATDGLRTLRDVNHRTGLNVLKGDCSVGWRDLAYDVVDELPADAMGASENGAGDDVYAKIWEILGSPPE